MTVPAFFYFIKDHFDKYLREKNIQKPVILFVDCHVSHLSIQVTEYCYQNGIALVCLLAFTTHLLQPLDLAVFKAMKEAWKVMVGQFRLQMQRDPCKYEVPELIEELMRTFPLNESVINGFRKAGLYPWNAEAVAYEKCRFSKETNPWLEEDEVIPDEPASEVHTNDKSENFVSKTFLQIFEENIKNNVLTEFRNSLKEGSLLWHGNVQHTALYEMWLQIHSQNESFVPASAIQSPASNTIPSSNNNVLPVADTVPDDHANSCALLPNADLDNEACETVSDSTCMSFILDNSIESGS